MRTDGLLTTITAADPPDHVCWVYDDDGGTDERFDDAVAQFLDGGRARGERLLVIGERVIDALSDEVAQLRGSGALETLTLAEAYAGSGEFTPEQQLAYYEDQTRRALDDGFRGLRVVAEASGLAADPVELARLVAWEHVADAYIARGEGMTALCAYRADLPADALADLASVHPLVNSAPEVAPLRVFAGDDAVTVTGSIDAAATERLARVLASTPVGAPTVVLDLHRVDFVDVAGCRTLARWAQGLAERAVQVEIRGGSRLLRRMWEILALADVAPVSFAEAAA